MRLGYSRSKNSIFYYAQKTVYVDGKNKSLIVKKFGSEKYICDTYGVTDAKAWAQEQIALMNLAEKEETSPISIDFSPVKSLADNTQRCFNGGYLFLQDIYYELGFELHQIYRALSVIAEESDYIQSTLFKNSMKLSKRKTGRFPLLKWDFLWTPKGIMKSEFDARPVYLQDSERIKAHFMTCFIALIVYRYLEKKLDEKYTCNQLIDCLREMKNICAQTFPGCMLSGSCSAPRPHGLYPAVPPCPCISFVIFQFPPPYTAGSLSSVFCEMYVHVKFECLSTSHPAQNTSSPLS